MSHKFRIPVYFTYAGKNPAEAMKKAHDKVGKGQNIEYGNPAMVLEDGSPMPKVSPELARFLQNEINVNDEDPSGNMTDLDYVQGSFQQMPPENVVESAGYDGDKAADVFAGELMQEFNKLYDACGGGTPAYLLLPPDDDGDQPVKTHDEMIAAVNALPTATPTAPEPTPEPAAEAPAAEAHAPSEPEPAAEPAPEPKAETPPAESNGKKPPAKKPASKGGSKPPARAAAKKGGQKGSGSKKPGGKK